MGRQDNPDKAGTIETARAGFVAALRSGDAKAASAVYAEGAKLLAPAADVIEGRDAIEAFWREGLEAGVFDVELVMLDLEQGNRLAYEIGRYALRSRPSDGGPVIDAGKYLLVHQRQRDGSWRRAVEMFNPDAPPTRDGARKEDRCSA